MDLLIEFVTANYVWIIVAGIVLLMAVVGYIADKTDFGRNKIEKEPKEKEVVEEDIVETEEVQLENNEIEVESKKEKKKKEKKKKDKKEKVVEELPIIETTLETPITENLEQPISENVDPSFSFPSEENVVEQSQVDQSLFEPLPSMDEVFTEQPVEQNNDFVNPEPVNLTSNENQESPVEDDIWKF